MKRALSPWLAAIAAMAALAMPAPVRGDITGSSTAPAYNAAGLVQAAAEIVEPLAPNTLATLYGTNLSFETHAAGVSDLSGGNLPIVLEGVSVFVNFLPVPMLLFHPRRLTS